MRKVRTIGPPMIFASSPRWSASAKVIRMSPVSTDALRELKRPGGRRTVLYPGRVAGLIVKAMRPRQWLKNVFVLAPVLFTGQAGNAHFLGEELAAALCFCGLSGGVYVVNDLCDRRRDALHPVKRRRPVASGELPVAAAWAAALAALGGSLMLAAALSGPFLLVAGVYVLLMLAYSLGLKNVVLADVLSIAAG